MFARCVMSSSEELIELVRKLKRERSFIYAEQKHIREQYTQVNPLHLPTSRFTVFLLVTQTS